MGKIRFCTYDSKNRQFIKSSSNKLNNVDRHHLVFVEKDSLTGGVMYSNGGLGLGRST